MTGPRGPPPALAPLSCTCYHRGDRFPRPASPAVEPPAPHVFPRGPQPALCGVRCSQTTNTDSSVSVTFSLPRAAARLPSDPSWPRWGPPPSSLQGCSDPIHQPSGPFSAASPSPPPDTADAASLGPRAPATQNGHLGGSSPRGGRPHHVCTHRLRPTGPAPTVPFHISKSLSPSPVCLRRCGVTPSLSTLTGLEFDPSRTNRCGTSERTPLEVCPFPSSPSSHLYLLPCRCCDRRSHT